MSPEPFADLGLATNNILALRSSNSFVSTSSRVEAGQLFEYGLLEKVVLGIYADSTNPSEVITWLKAA